MLQFSDKTLPIDYKLLRIFANHAIFTKLLRTLIGHALFAIFYTFTFFILFTCTLFSLAYIYIYKQLASYIRVLMKFYHYYYYYYINNSHIYISYSQAHIRYS